MTLQSTNFILLRPFYKMHLLSQHTKIDIWVLKCQLIRGMCICKFHYMGPDEESSRLIKSVVSFSYVHRSEQLVLQPQAKFCCQSKANLQEVFIIVGVECSNFTLPVHPSLLLSSNPLPSLKIIAPLPREVINMFRCHIGRGAVQPQHAIDIQWPTQSG